jgi:putative oxidoreductase
MKYDCSKQSKNDHENTLTKHACSLVKTEYILTSYQKITGFLDNVNDTVPMLLLRLILAFEFWEAGMMKLDSESWFDQISFPFPFNLFSNDLLWMMGTWLELIGAIALFVGLGTRVFTLAMILLTLVAINTVHWPTQWHSLAELGKGYAINDSGNGNYKLPLIYLVMFMPLLFGGAGKWSLDYAIKRLFFNQPILK